MITGLLDGEKFPFFFRNKYCGSVFTIASSSLFGNVVLWIMTTTKTVRLNERASFVLTMDETRFRAVVKTVVFYVLVYGFCFREPFSRRPFHLGRANRSSRRVRIVCEVS